MKNTIFVFIALVMIQVSGCSSPKFSPFPKYGGKIEGTVWCQSRYLDMVGEYQVKPKDPNSEYGKKLRLAKEGFVYALAATLTLQDKDSKYQYNFIMPSYIKQIDELTENHANGFQAETFVYENPVTKDAELIIAFRGSDQFFKDYLLQNFALWQVQNEPAREYVVKAVAYRDAHKGQFGKKVVVTGNSLGGALAAHVANHRDTRDLITDAWAFNPSPRTSVRPPDGENPKVRLLSTDQEILNMFRRKNIGAPLENQSTDYNLISSSSVYNHYRWVLAREILWYADLAMYFDSGKKAQTTPPLEILKAQTITDAACQATEIKTRIRRDQYNAKIKTIDSSENGVIAGNEIKGIKY